jgi:hypothetical protein
MKVAKSAFVQKVMTGSKKRMACQEEVRGQPGDGEEAKR